MQRIAAILLVAVFAATGSGLVQFLHLEEHLSSAAASAKAADSSFGNPAAPGHDEANCAICAVIHLQFSASSALPLLVCLGLAVAFLTMLAPRLQVQSVPARIDCRGPPRR